MLSIQRGGKEMKREHCPECGKFLSRCSSHRLARKADGSKIHIIITGLRCSCGYKRLENYADKVALLGLKPW